MSGSTTGNGSSSEIEPSNGDNSVDTNSSPKSEYGLTAYQKHDFIWEALPTSGTWYTNLWLTRLFKSSTQWNEKEASVQMEKEGCKVVAVKKWCVLECECECDLNKILISHFQKWDLLNHPSIVPFLGMMHGNDSGNFVSLVCPWYEDGNIMNYLEKRELGPDRVEDVDVMGFLRDIASALEYMHEAHLSHRHLLGRNILITRDPGSISHSGRFKARALLSDPFIHFPKTDSTPGVYEIFDDRVQDARWMAPEVLIPQTPAIEKTETLCAGDVWSFGMTVLEVLTLNKPFKNHTLWTEVLLRVSNGETPSRPVCLLVGDGLGTHQTSVLSTTNPDRERIDRWNRFLHLISDSMWERLNLCWEQKPEDRPKMGEVSKWFVDEVSSLDDANAEKHKPSPPAPAPSTTCSGDPKKTPRTELPARSSRIHGSLNEQSLKQRNYTHPRFRIQT